MLTADMLVTDLKMLNPAIEALMRQGIQITSVLDNVIIQNRKLFLSRYEKSLFVGAAVTRISGYKRKETFFSDTQNTKNEHEGINVGIYCRVSTREQTLGYSIDSQKQKNVAYMDLFDYNPKHIEYYVDEDQSAKNLKRKELMRMLQDVSDGKLDEIIIYKLDRLTRSVIDTYSLIQLFLNHKINLTSVSDHLDIQTANGKMIVGILAIFAQWERETTIERTSDGQLQMAFEGKYPHPNTPLGYKKDEDKFLHIDESTACIVKDIFKWAKAGNPLSEIKRKVFDVYGMDMRIDRIRRILFENGYFAEFEYKDYIFGHIFPKLVSKEDALAARSIIGRRVETYGKEQTKFYFRHKVRCEQCGELTIGIPTYKKKKRYYYYYCQTCKKRINQELLEQQVLFDMLAQCKKSANDQLFAEVKRNEQKIERKIRALTRNYLSEQVSEDAYIVSLQVLQGVLEKEKGKLGEMKIIDGTSWKELSDNEKRNIVEETILTITVDFERRCVKKMEFQ